jgi:hypothetical protein
MLTLDHPAGLTSDRNEDKYLLPARCARPLARCLAPRLPPQRADAGLAWAEQRVTTVYFDTERRDLYRAALSNPVHVKVRARVYRDAHSGRPARGSGVDFAQAGHSPVFVEIKVREGQRSRKRRACIEQHDVARFFEDPAAVADLQQIGPGDRAELEAIAIELQRMRAQLGPLRASCVVSYKRLAFERPGQPRITLDRALAAFAPAAQLWSRGAAVERPVAGPAAFHERACIVEVKSRGLLPEWVAPLLARHDATAVEYSKFVVASRAVHGPVR